MPPKKKKLKNPAYVDWRLCPAKWVIITDLEDGMLPLDRELCSPEDAWKVYEEARLPEFEGVCFQQFKERLADHRRAVKRSQGALRKQLDALEHDKVLHPRNETHDRRGAPIFSRSPAHDLLRTDIKDGLYPLYKPKELWETRPEYKLFSLDVFRGRIYQEIHRNKYINWLEMKRAKQISKGQAPPARSKGRDYAFSGDDNADV